MLSDRQLDLMRAQAERGQPELVDVLRRVVVDDGFGGVEDQAPTVAITGLPFRITPAQLIEQVGQAARELQTDMYIGRAPVGTDLRIEDSVLFPDGRQFTIKKVNTPRSYDTALTTTLELVR